MPVVNTIPTPLVPFIHFGCHLTYTGSEIQAKGDCPFCENEGKFFVNQETGQWDCKVCHEDGNVYGFIRKVYEISKKYTDENLDKLKELADDRGLLPQSLEAWGIRYSFLKDEWLIPGFDSAKRMNNVYRRCWDNLNTRWYLNGAKGLNHQMFGVDLFDQKKEDVYICEGVWDAIALWEVLRYTRLNTENSSGLSESPYLQTGNPKLSILANANVIGVPSCSVFSEYFCPLLAGKRVFLLYHNDHPDKQGRCAGPEGMKRTANILMSATEPPKEILAINWAIRSTDETLSQEEKDSGLKSDISLKKGYDIRDAITEYPNSDKSNRVKAVESVFSRIVPIPVNWIEGATGKKGKPVIEPLECDRWDIVRAAVEKAMVVTEGHDRALCFMFACAASVDVDGDQLWGKVISPPSGGKTTLVDGFITAREYAILRSITTGIHSGWKDKDANDPNADSSLMAAVKGKCMIVKDADTLLQADNLPKTLSELRDAYDRTASTHYRNSIQRDYVDHSFTVLLLGTPEIRKLDQSELGQRMVDCVIMEKIDKDLENEINRRTIDRIRRLMMSQDIAKNGDGSDGKEMSDAKRLIGGYLIYLRKEMRRLVAGIRMSDDAAKKIDEYAKFVAHFRARPSTTILRSGKSVASASEEASRELSTRLLVQFIKLGYCSAAVLGRSTIDEEVLRRVRQSALDTARGKTVQLAKILYAVHEKGIDRRSLMAKSAIEDREIKALLAFLQGIDVVESFTPEGKIGLGVGGIRYRLTNDIQKLYGTVMNLIQSTITKPTTKSSKANTIKRSINQNSVSTKKSKIVYKKPSTSVKISKVKARKK